MCGFNCGYHDANMLMEYQRLIFYKTQTVKIITFHHVKMNLLQFFTCYCLIMNLNISLSHTHTCTNLAISKCILHVILQSSQKEIRRYADRNRYNLKPKRLHI